MTQPPDDAARKAAEHMAKHFLIFGPCLIPKPGVELPSCHEPETLICCGCEIQRVFLAGAAWARERAEEEIKRLKAELAEREKRSDIWMRSDTEARDYANRLRAQVACLREGLEHYAQWTRTGYIGGDPSIEAREALARAKELEGGG